MRGSGLGDPVTDNWPDFGMRVTIDETVRASCVRLIDIPEYIGASTQSEKFLWYWTVSSKRLKDGIAQTFVQQRCAESFPTVAPLRDALTRYVMVLPASEIPLELPNAKHSAWHSFRRGIRFLALLRISHTEAVEAGLLGRRTDGEI